MRHRSRKSKVQLQRWDSKFSSSGCFSKLVERSKSRVTMSIQFPNVVKPHTKRAGSVSRFLNHSFRTRSALRWKKSKFEGSMKLYMHTSRCRRMQKKRIASRIACAYAQKIWLRRSRARYRMVHIKPTQKYMVTKNCLEPILCAPLCISGAAIFDMQY